ncbi:N,N-dimethylformamidase beta subunit family domain-containing protein [Vulgatibacter incomptus]|uniref:N,N-dimethylformamidase beta subunit-like C-terminal domain-containing protein n=1 Tax=Vulgatibacter incomptus TaxID=1391653 RepID=A0A0K1P9R2_9BACT|nr:N,N-dimethylformamidase beta subunit family domain-containing protein [Vulgatibacter incomptus]AKU90268.1 hypothetical protein AKJ08_0655 [Vulgatibacter incomptus]
MLVQRPFDPLPVRRALSGPGLILFLLLAAGCSGGPDLVGKTNPETFTPPDHGTPPRPPRAWPPVSKPGSPIAQENQQPGEPGWDVIYDAWDHQIEGYAERVSARAGEKVRIMLSSTAARKASWKLYRLGWYGGAGARVVSSGGPVDVTVQPPCPPDPVSGLVRCKWTPTFELTIPADAVSGLYALKAVRDDGYTRFVPLVVVDDRPADLLLQANVTTYQAYNAWGGTSLYVDRTGKLPLRKATQVSFDRPYDGDYGGGQMFRYEAQMVKLLEHWDYDVTYTTNVDVAWGGWPVLYGRGALLDAGHDEYWSVEERDAVEKARDAGVHLLFFGANTAYWKIRFENWASERNPRTFSCYKGGTKTDPVQGAQLTGRYRDPPIDRPENALLGVMYESWSIRSSPWVVADDSSFLYTGTGLRRGDTIRNIVGYEYDRLIDNGATPATFRVAGRSPVLDAEGKPGWSEGGSYTASSGAFVFASGSIEWVLGLTGGPRPDPRVDRMTANVIQAALSIAPPRGLGDGALPADPSPSGPFASSVTTIATGLAGPAGVTALPDGRLAVVDTRKHRVVEVGPAPTRTVTPIAGDGNLSNNPAYDNVPGLRARFFSPTGILAVPGGIFVADTYNHCIRKILDGPDRKVIPIAGVMGVSGYRDGDAGQALFDMPMGMAEDPLTGDILVADMNNHRIRVLEKGTWRVRTLAGNGVLGDADGPAAQAAIGYPSAVAVAGDGTVYVVATGSAKLLRVGTDPAHTVTTLAGGIPGYQDGSGDLARIAPQGGLTWDGSGLLLTEPTNFRIRRIVPGRDARSTVVTTLAGTGRFGNADGPGDRAEIPLPMGIAVGPDGTIYVADGNGAIRAIRR